MVIPNAQTSVGLVSLPKKRSGAIQGRKASEFRFLNASSEEALSSSCLIFAIPKPLKQAVSDEVTRTLP